MALLRSLYGIYEGWVLKHPTTTRALTAGSLYFVGDLVSQKIEAKWLPRHAATTTPADAPAPARRKEDLALLPPKPKGDEAATAAVPVAVSTKPLEREGWRRAAGFGMAGLMYGGPLEGLWYQFLDKRLPGTRWTTIVRKVLIDQTVFAPLFLVGFFTVIGLIEGHTLHSIGTKLRNEFLLAYMTDCAFWPLLQALNFRHVPPTGRVLFLSTGSIAWNAFLSVLQHRDEGDEGDESGGGGGGGGAAEAAAITSTTSAAAATAVAVPAS